MKLKLLKRRLAVVACLSWVSNLCSVPAQTPSPRPHVELRAIYGGFPEEITRAGKRLSDYGINAVFIGPGSLTPERVSRLKEEGCRVFAEFNSMHAADYLEEHPDAAPVGPDGKREPPAEGWSDWGEPVPVEQVFTVLDHGSRSPATGVIVFAWGSLRNQPAKIEELGRFYRGITAPETSLML